MVSNASKLVREATMAVKRSLGLIDESRDLIERANQFASPEKIKAIRCARCAAKAPLVRREPVDSQAIRKTWTEIWTFECVSCGQRMQRFDRGDFAGV